MIKFIERFQFTPAVLVLIVMNLIPLAGVFWFGWDAGTIVFLYWLENVIIGLLNIPKILSCQGLNKKPMTAQSRRPHKNTIGKRLFVSLFFSIHYGVFCLVHYIFIQAFFTQMPKFEVLLPTLIDSVLFWSLLGLAFSHLMSMALNFYGKGEYKTRAPREQMKLPYPRVMVLHIVILAGAGLVIAYGQAAIMLALLVLIKIGFDLSAHLVEHSKKERSPISSVS